MSDGDCACLRNTRDKRYAGQISKMASQNPIFPVKSMKCLICFRPENYAIFLLQWTKESKISKPGMFLKTLVSCIFFLLFARLLAGDFSTS